MVLSLGVSHHVEYIGEWGYQGSRRPPQRGQTLGHARWPPGSLVVALWPHPGDSGRFPYADFLSDFPKFLEHS